MKILSSGFYIFIYRGSEYEVLKSVDDFKTWNKTNWSWSFLKIKPGQCVYGRIVGTKETWADDFHYQSEFVEEEWEYSTTPFKPEIVYDGK